MHTGQSNRLITGTIALLYVGMHGNVCVCACMPACLCVCGVACMWALVCVVSVFACVEV